MSKSEMKKIQGNLILCMICLIIVGMVSRIIGEIGTAELTFTFSVFLAIYSFFIAWIPDYMTKMVRFRVLKEQYKNVDMVWRTMLAFSIVIGILGTVVLFFVSNFIEKNNNSCIYFSYLLMKRMAFLFLPITITLVCTGYFRGNGAGSMSLYIFLLPLLLGIPLILLFTLSGFQKGKKIADVLHNSDLAGIYGGLGSIHGIFFVLGLVFLAILILFFVRKKKVKKNRDGLRLTEDASDILLPVFANTSADSLSKYAMYGILFWGFLFYIMRVNQSEGDRVMAQQSLSDIGRFYGNFLVMAAFETCIIVFAMLRIVSVHLNSLKRDDKRMIRHSMDGVILGTFLSALFFGALNIGAAGSIAKLFFGKDMKEFVNLIRIGSLMPLFMAGSVIFTILLKETNKKKNILLYYLIAFAVFIFGVLISFRFMQVSVYPILIGLYAFYILTCILCSVKYVWKFSYRPEWVRMIIMPLIVVSLTTLCVYFINKALYQATNALVAFCFSFVTGYVIYNLVLIFMRCIQESDTDVLPFGGIKRTIGNLLHIMV